MASEDQKTRRRRSRSCLFGGAVLIVLAAAFGWGTYRVRQLFGDYPLSIRQAAERLQLQFPEGVRVLCFYQCAPPGQMAAEMLLTPAQFREFTRVNGLGFRLVEENNEDVKRYVAMAHRTSRERVWRVRDAERALLDDARVEVYNHSGTHVGRKRGGKRPELAFANQAILAVPDASGGFRVLCVRWG